MLRFAAELSMQLQNPYTVVPGFYNPPWMLLLMAPFALIPLQVGFALWTVIGVACYALSFRRMGFGWPVAAILMFSPLAVGNLMFGNYDWLLLLGATLPPAFGIWFVALKPQLGAVLASLWIWQSVKTGLRTFAIVVLPIATAVLLSLVLGYRLPESGNMAWSADVWPFGIPIGAVACVFRLPPQRSSAGPCGSAIPLPVCGLALLDRCAAAAGAKSMGSGCRDPWQLGPLLVGVRVLNLLPGRRWLLCDKCGEKIRLRRPGRSHAEFVLAAVREVSDLAG